MQRTADVIDSLLVTAGLESYLLTEIVEISGHLFVMRRRICHERLERLGEITGIVEIQSLGIQQLDRIRTESSGIAMLQRVDENHHRVCRHAIQLIDRQIFVDGLHRAKVGAEHSLV